MTDDSKPLPQMKASEVLKTALEIGPVAMLRGLLSTFRVALRGTTALQADSAKLQEIVDRTKRDEQDRHR